MKTLSIATLGLLASTLPLTGCSDDNDDGGSPSTTRNFTVTIQNIAPIRPFTSGGVFTTPMGDAQPGPIVPGKAYEFTVHAGRKQRLSFVTMLAATNDLFYAPDGEGIALYDDQGDPISGDVTSQVFLWDAGTEVNEEPRVGPNTVTNQEEADTGPSENGDVVAIEDVAGDGFAYPRAEDLMTVTVTHEEGTEFTVRIENVSPEDALMTSEGDFPAPLSPGVWVVHSRPDPLFAVGAPDRSQGIEHIAEDGNPMLLGAFIGENAGVTFPASPGVWVVHSEGTMPLFTNRGADYGDGLEHIAEDGNPMLLGGALTRSDGFQDAGVFNMPVGSSAPGPILPGSRYIFSFEARPGTALSFATMLAATNDVFFAPMDRGLALFDADGVPLSGVLTSDIQLWDAGTELNEEPALGPGTVSNQSGPNTGQGENEPVQVLSEVRDGFTYPNVSEVLEVKIESEPSE